MKNNDGYTILELVIVIVVIGIFSFIAINKVSYAFEDTNITSIETEELIIKKAATRYALSIIDTIKDNDVYITGKDLVDDEYLVDDEHQLYNIKLKLSYDSDKSSPLVEILR